MSKGAVAGVGHGSGFALLVVLFILLIIIGTAYTGAGYY
ncbi:YjcZ family sporulation protein [Virgibacillus sp. C22-A2]|uniref:YjcZ family sporulation protein n=1 Tax=Virgibacillus tibetensis TaxID=3042313 RepID=A0ABU6KEH6_9BACI|nr:YjcZ family sporulation protein [Virgibacillus sp. C22-A2]